MSIRRAIELRVERDGVLLSESRDGRIRP